MKKLRVMIVSHPGAWQRVLQKNLEAYPFVKVVDVVNGSLSALQLARENSPDIILIDSSVPFEDAIALVQNTKRENLEIRSIVITDTTQQRRRVIRVGADHTISSFSYESQIGEILNQLNKTNSNRIAGSEATIKTDPNLTDQVNS